MLLRKYWIPLLVFIVAIAGVGLYYLQTRPPKEPIVIITPVEPLEKPTAKTPVVEQPEQVGHFHEDGTFHAEPPALVAESSPIEAETPVDVTTPTRTGPLTYHADLLASNPVGALRAQAEERGHWSARWIPPFPSDDGEAAALAHGFYHIVYYRSKGEIDTPKARQTIDELIPLWNTVVMKDNSPRGDDLLRLSWAMLESGDIDPTYFISNFDLPLK